MDQKIKKYLGIDWGEARIGVSLGDSENRIAIPFKVAITFEEVLEVIKEEEIDAIIIGQPVKMSGDKLTMQKEYTGFVNSIKKKTGLPIITVDERLSSKAADALDGGRNIKAERDAVAAMLILQSFLDTNK